MKPSLLLSALAFALAFATDAKTYNSPIGFYENKGQIIDQNNNPNPAVKYLWNGNGIKVQLKTNSFSYEVLKTEKFLYRNSKMLRTKHSLGKKSLSDNYFGDSIVTHSHRIDIEFLGANPHPQIFAEGKNEDYDNYYTTGTPEEGVTFVYHYSKVTYKDIYPNIDLEFVSDAKNEKGFKYNFIVRPGGNVADIQLQYKGATNTTLNKQGNLVVATTSGDFEESIPKSYVAETGENVSVHYAAKGGNVFGFQANTYASNQTLIIDPWCTYYGSSTVGAGGDIATDNTNNVVVTGWTASTTNIASSSAYQTTYGGGNYDAFVVKFNSSCSRLWGTYYGGNDIDAGMAIALDIVGNIYVNGVTRSTSGISTSGVFQSTFIGTSYEGMLIKFNANGVRQWGTYYGGNTTSYDTEAHGIALDSNGNIFVTGETTSPSNIASVGTYQSTLPSPDSAGGYIIKFDSSGNRIWGTYVYYCFGSDVVVDNIGNVFFAGRTLNDSAIATLGCFQSVYGGGEDAVLAKFNSSGTQLLWRTYYGGYDLEYNYTGCLSLDNAGNIVMVGVTSSDNNIASSGAYQDSLYGLNNSYIAKFNTNGFRLWGTYFGGSYMDNIYSSTTDNVGNIYVTGTSFSSNKIATIGAYQTTKNGYSDVFLAKFSSSGSRLWSTYFGGTNNNSQNEQSNAVAVDGLGNVIIAGFTEATSNISTLGAFQTAPASIFIASFDSLGYLPPTPPITNNSITASQNICSNVQPTLLTGSIPSGGNGVSTYSYKWLKSTNSSTSGFTIATGTNNTQNYQPPMLSVTTWYKRVVMSGNTADTTTAIQITVLLALPAATITASGPTTFCQGNSVTLNANTGTGLSYQWYNGSTVITGATNSSYVSIASGSYKVVITNINNCTTNSNIINVTVTLPPANISVIGATTFCQGDSIALYANTGTGLYYQWYDGAVAIGGATNNTYIATVSGSYHVDVTQTGCTGIGTSSTATVIVNPNPTISITAGGATTFCQGNNVTLNANTGAGYNYQWYNGTSSILGATDSSYVATISGSFSVIVTNSSNCSDTSSAVTVTVTPLPTVILIQPSTDIWCEGDTVGILASASSGVTAYQWQQNGVNISGATNNFIKAYTTGYFTVIVTALGCSTTSSPMFDSFITAPIVTIVQSGNNLSATTGFYNYQWYFNGLPITGATNQSYTPTQNGDYTLKGSLLNGCSGLSNVISFTVGIDEVNDGNWFSVSPNPFNESFVVSCESGNGTITVTDAVGREIPNSKHQIPMSGELTIDMKGFASGVYILRYENDVVCETVKIVKE